MSESSLEQSSEHSEYLESRWEYYGTSDYDYYHDNSESSNYCSDDDSETSHRSERFEILESTETIINSKFNICYHFVYYLST